MPFTFLHNFAWGMRENAVFVFRCLRGSAGRTLSLVCDILPVLPPRVHCTRSGVTYARRGKHCQNLEVTGCIIPMGNLMKRQKQ